MKNLFVAVTDLNWYERLSSNAPWQEVNFWKPSRTGFKAIEEGELLLFKLKSPKHMIAGFGTLAAAHDASIREAWDSLGMSNGVNSLQDFVATISKALQGRAVDQNTLIGVRILVDPVFLPESDWITVPEDWSNSIVSGKTYSLDTLSGRKLLEKVFERSDQKRLFRLGRERFEGFSEEPQAGYLAPSTFQARMGQASFRANISKAYNYACAVTGTPVRIALEAAHIEPFSTTPNHAYENGILLRSDIHKLFDAGLIGFSDSYRVIISPDLKLLAGDFGEYIGLEGKLITLPYSKSNYPSIEAIRKHRAHHSLPIAD